MVREVRNFLVTRQDWD